MTQTYVTQNKYVGREIRTEEFSNALASYLNDGERLLVHQIPNLLQQIYGLAAIMSRLKGYRFYGCSLLFIYDGDHEVQEAYRKAALDSPASSGGTSRARGESLDRDHHRQSAAHRRGRDSSTTRGSVAPAETKEPAGVDDSRTLRRSHSEDILVAPSAKRSNHGRKKRGEVIIRLVDFAHTTTGRDYVPYPPGFVKPAVPPEVSSGKGYQADIDPETGRIYARFPPHHPDLPDLGFIFGLKNLAGSLEKIWEDERTRRAKKHAREGVVSPGEEMLGALPSEGKQIFDTVFKTEGEDLLEAGYLST